MRIDLAHNIRLGDLVYNCFMEPFIVQERIVATLDTHPSHNYIKLIVKDHNNKIHEYSFEDLYLCDLEGEDDAEKSWVEWAKDNKDFLTDFDHLETMREIYKTGFCNGFEYKRKITFEEAMQK